MGREKITRTLFGLSALLLIVPGIWLMENRTEGTTAKRDSRGLSPRQVLSEPVKLSLLQGRALRAQIQEDHQLSRGLLGQWFFRGGDFEYYAKFLPEKKGISMVLRETHRGKNSRQIYHIEPCNPRIYANVLTFCKVEERVFPDQKGAQWDIQPLEQYGNWFLRKVVSEGLQGFRKEEVWLFSYRTPDWLLVNTLGEWSLPEQRFILRRIK